ncbi:DUF676-domain-containing protein [Pleomassaria siparia CBS 279.74]|uniref:DUF676-domain-containing protein n=1 Tax=Pleomassaria siparia CBS 279.74 TaxID=1314801 RepID=A0A6G1KJM5_9PLEO|nr:DUF676-domain-containing protein [Pleomassaria siparia CBS 279.74]
MLLNPRTYGLAQTPDAGSREAISSYFLLTPSRKELLAEEHRARRMLLLHQSGNVKVGQVVRYTLTYTPSEDRILPSPALLHVKIKNTSALPLRAAYLHGPYNLHVAAYPSTFNPNKKVESPKRDGVPEFEPNLKAGGSWAARLTVPEHIRETGGNRETSNASPGSATWVIEIASQVIFSQSASVSYELLVARDERSLDLGFTAITGNTHGTPGQVQDHREGKHLRTGTNAAHSKGVYSKAVKLVVDDITSLWNKPALPDWDDDQPPRPKSGEEYRDKPKAKRKQRKIHLVILTHGLHSNLGADMLYLKESIDATAKQAREDRRQRRKENPQSASKEDDQRDISTAPLSGGQEDIQPEDEDEDEDEEDVVVRGFEGNVIRTERGIQYLGKRMAKHVLGLTYPDQPFLPRKRSVGKKLLSPGKDKDKLDDGIPAHAGSSILEHHTHEPTRAYKYTSISFVGHSLGGLVQTYAIAYIHKHSPQFFESIKPINFIAMASPFLGLSNENPMYIKFALDFGLVGRTGQDLGLTWRAPTLAKSGWTAMVSGLSAQSQSQQQRQDDPGAKPLLRILPTGPAHLVLRMFRNRTVYSNVVNDGIVPLRTSCLLFLDWRGLGKVEKARRENGLIGTVAGWGWGQLTGQSTSPNPSRMTFSEEDNSGIESPPLESPPLSDDSAVPQPGVDDTNQDDEARAAAEPSAIQFLDGQKHDPDGRPISPTANQSSNTLTTLWNYIRPSGKHTSKDRKMFKRSQTVQNEQSEGNSDSGAGASSEESEQPRKRPQATRGDTQLGDGANLSAPPKTTIFESAGDLLSPPVPPNSWITDPSTRARTIFHDRVYHPEDIPPPPGKRRPTGRSVASENSNSSQISDQSAEESGMRVEEKIARAYHKDLSWRKVLVRLEPDAHNNIVVRRMFANAYGWPVIKHLCDTHFADTYAATTRDEQEPAIDRAKGMKQPVEEDGEHVKGQEDTQPPIERTESEQREVRDELAPLKKRPLYLVRANTGDSTRSRESVAWDDSYFDGTSDEEDELDERSAIQKFLQQPPPKNKAGSSSTVPRTPDKVGTSEAEITAFLSGSSLELHRGIGVSPQKPSKAAREPDAFKAMVPAPKRVLEEGKQTSSPPQSPANISDVGLSLRKSLEVSPPISPQAGRARSGSTSVTEQVARLSSSKEADIK